jgi:hypothetical protein
MPSEMARSAPQRRAGQWADSCPSPVSGFYAVDKNDILYGINFLNCVEDIEPLVHMEGAR